MRDRRETGNPSFCFYGKNSVYHKVAPTRLASEINQVMRQLAVKVRGCDCYSAQLKAPVEDSGQFLAQAISFA